MTQNNPLLQKLKLNVPRHWLFFSVATIWLFASFRIFLTAWEGVLKSHTPVYLFVIVSFMGAIIFTRLVFSKVTARYILRINSMDADRPSLFTMFSGKSYLLIAFMITMGITLKKLDIIPLNFFSMFLGSLGLSLFTSALNFLRAWRIKPLIESD